MRILLTGATGYVGRRLLPVLVNQGHHVVCLVRDSRRFDWEDFSEDFLKHVEVVEGDLARPESLQQIPRDLDAAYYLVPSLNAPREFTHMEAVTARNFVEWIDASTVQGWGSFRFFSFFLCHTFIIWLVL